MSPVHKRNIAALQELLAANDVAAAQQKLTDVIKAAEADGQIDADERRLIDHARSELEAIKVRAFNDMYIYIYKYMYMCMYIYVYICIYEYTCVYI
jgi:hypothetical protein